jgi:hypothetical protein
MGMIMTIMTNILLEGRQYASIFYVSDMDATSKSCNTGDLPALKRLIGFIVLAN